jgi:hypothetical protein
MSTLQHKVLVVGLPQTGKTTFLAALWDVVGSGEVKGSLRLVRLEGEKQHLNDLRDLWADCHKIPRTQVANEKVVSMLLSNAASGVTSEVSFSDMSGESFEKQWTERVWTRAYEDLIREVTGVLLFVHPEAVHEAPLIRDARGLIKRLTGDEPSGVTRANLEGPGEHSIPAEPRYAATQVQLVELLQLIRWQKRAADGLRVGVIVSAWDLVDGVESRKSPELWLRERLPLLHQYLVAHSDATPFLVFGVSAQGGDLDKDVDRLRMSHQASDRILVVQGRQRSRDITLPVRWAMGALNE